MSEYTIRIEGHESGLTASAVEDMVGGMFPDAENVEVVEGE
jgi:hypothetical protein